ncbi:hypothetical protein HN954_03785 [bacterium]|nr:hypothetical protein [bacterium]MBT6831868.1 hypothetical protein [bacterium]MBT6996522.1 hypothetical protein [bacterium]MBT7773015.1 hypothetical protein [bacterium]
MEPKFSRVRKIPAFPHKTSSGIFGVFQFLIGLVIWIGLLILFAIGLWSWWFSRSIVRIFKFRNLKIPWWFGWLCTIFVFPATVVVILIAELKKIFFPKK